MASVRDAPVIAALARTRSQNERLRAELQLNLPPGWGVDLDPSGRPYYLNHVTKTTQWDPPAAVVAPTAPPSYSPTPAAVIAADAPGDVVAAVEHAECCICCEPLHSGRCSVLTRGGRRVCGHFFHCEPCAGSLAKGHAGGQTCPICRTEYDGTMPVPSLETDPEGWFRTVDLDGNGTLDQSEVLGVLKALLPVDYRRLEETLPGLWAEWDRDGSGVLERDELFGLIDYVKREMPRGAEAPAPDIKVDRAGWFRHFDEDDSGSLDKGEVTRALIKTFRLSTGRDTPSSRAVDLRKVEEIRQVLECIWPIFDPDMSMTIDTAEFAASGGLAETIIASMDHL